MPHVPWWQPPLPHPPDEVWNIKSATGWRPFQNRLFSVPLPPDAKARPGAFAVTHRSASTEPDDQTVGTVEILSSPQEGTHQAECDVVSMLVQATLVEDGDAIDPNIWIGPDLSKASASSIDRDRKSAHQQDRPRGGQALGTDSTDVSRIHWTRFNILLTISLVSVALALGVLALQRPADGQNAALPPSRPPGPLAVAQMQPISTIFNPNRPLDLRHNLQTRPQ